VRTHDPATQLGRVQSQTLSDGHLQRLREIGRKTLNILHKPHCRGQSSALQVPIDIRPDLGAAFAARSGKNIAVIANRAGSRHFVDHCGRAFLYGNPVSPSRLSQGGYDDIHQLHSDQLPDARIEPALVEGNELAPLEGHYTETHNYGSAGAGAGLAASRRSSLVVQKIYRRGSRLAFTSSPRSGRADGSGAWLINASAFWRSAPSLLRSAASSSGRRV
jgi:hypothetical protein